MVLSNMRRYRIYLYCGGGAACLSIGAFLLYSYMAIYKTILYQQLKMTPGSETFKIWRDTPVPQTMKFYLFNWTNPGEIEDLSTKPKLKQMGPYCFKVFEKKTNITWNNNGTITFRIQRTWFFDPENSNGSLDDDVTTLNALAMSAANTVRYKALYLKKGLSTGLWATKQEIHVTKKVGDLLFFGYTDPLLEMAKQLPAFEGIEIPPYDKFAWFYLRNATDHFEGTFEMDTGINDVFSFGKLRHWNFDDKTKFYPSPCGLVNGSAGELFPPERNKSKIEMFSADLCRSIALSYSEEVEIQGIKGYKYSGDQYTFDNGTLDPSNECFCEGECTRSGIMNSTNCRFGAPGFVSFPHFHLADEFYVNQVEGLEPKHEMHNIYITLEPNTGIPLDVSARFQVNILLSPIEGIALFKSVPKIFFPILWLEQQATITEELAAQVRLVLNLPLIIQCFGAFLVLVGLALFIVSVYSTVQPTNKEKPEDIKLAEGTAEPLIDTKNNTHTITSKQQLVSQT